MLKDLADATDWASLLTEPMAVLGPYGKRPPPLSSFAPHSLRQDFNLLALAGQFQDLPEQPPSTWVLDGVAKAYAVFEFHEVKDCSIIGAPQAAQTDDSMHGKPAGERGTPKLEVTDQVFLALPNKKLYWKSFTFQSRFLTINLLCSSVSLYVGRQAWRQYGWPQHA